MIQQKILFFNTIFFLIICLAGCGPATDSLPVGEGYAIFIADSDPYKPVTGMPDLEIVSPSSVSLNGALGTLQQVEGRFKISFEGKNAEGFKIVQVGNKDGDTIWFWLEFTKSGNCVIYSDTGTNFFKKYQRPKQKT